MKIRVERDQIVQAIRRMEGIEVVLENEHDAKEAVNLALGSPPFLNSCLKMEVALHYMV